MKILPIMSLYIDFLKTFFTYMYKNKVFCFKILQCDQPRRRAVLRSLDMHQDVIYVYVSCFIADIAMYCWSDHAICRVKKERIP